MKTRIHRTITAALALALALVALPAFAAEASGTVNVNSASAEQLQLLPNVGPALAQRIVEHRDKNGAFKTAEDLMLVRGIGEASFARLKPYVATSGSTTLTEKVRVPRAPKSAARSASRVETMRRPHELGFQLVELLVVVAVSGLVLLIGLPPLVRAAGGVTTRLAASEVATVMRLARMTAIREGAKVGLKFRTAADGTVTWTLHRDGDGDGVLTADIVSGVDPALGAPRRLAHFGRSVRFGFPPGRPPRDPANPRRRLDRLDDPIRFNQSDIASFAPIDGATPGSIYVTDGAGRLHAVRVLGRTGRVRVLTYDVVTERWR